MIEYFAELIYFWRYLWRFATNMTEIIINDDGY